MQSTLAPTGITDRKPLPSCHPYHTCQYAWLTARPPDTLPPGRCHQPQQQQSAARGAPGSCSGGVQCGGGGGGGPAGWQPGGAVATGAGGALGPGAAGRRARGSKRWRGYHIRLQHARLQARMSGGATVHVASTLECRERWRSSCTISCRQRQHYKRHSAWRASFVTCRCMQPPEPRLFFQERATP